MKRMIRSILLIAAGALVVQGATAQKLDLTEIVPNDSSVRVGTLPSGITYYIKQNAKPANRADFHIYYKVGAVQEEESQNGLAHFLEHMAFNGSKHFPENTLTDYLSSIGVRFGENLNAATGQEHTTYMITNVPMTRPGITDSVLLVLHDWAGYITLDTTDIDKERGVIIEEWRQGNNAGRRVFEKQAPVLFNNSIYAKRNIIGNQEVLKTFKYQELRDFYHRWYRPDMQAFVIVGDFNVDSMENKLKTAMADIPAPAVRTPKAVVTVDDNEKPLISVTSDPELTVTQVQMLFRHRPINDRYRNTYLAYKNDYITSLANRMLDQRLSEIAQKENAPFLGAGAGYQEIVRPFDAFYIGGTAREGEALRALEAMYTELLRMQNGGFTPSELDRAKTEILRGTESFYENRNDRKNDEFSGSYMTHFENGTPYITPETDKVVTRRVLDDITLAEVNATAADWVGDRNNVVLISMPEKEGNVLPAESDILTTLNKVRATDVAGYVDAVKDLPLLDASKLKGSKTIKTEPAGGMFSSTVLTLQNGVRVIVKSTDLKADEVQMTAFQKGGTTTVADTTDIYNLSLLPAYVGMSGVGDFSRIELGKLLTGKIANVSPHIGSLSQGFGGSCSPKDIETLMQLTYLYYTAPRFDSGDWNVLMNQYRSLLPNMVKNPSYILQDSLFQTVYGHNPRVFMQISDRVLNVASPERIKALYNRFFSNANGMTFIFVGNISADSLKPLAEKYLGSLPSKKGPAPKWGKHIVLPLPGIVQNMYKTPLQTPKMTAVEIYSGELPYTLQRSVTMDAIRYILEMRYTKAMREEKGGTYGVGVNLTYQKEPLPRFAFQISFETDPAKITDLLPIVDQEFRSIATSGATDEELTKTKEFFIKRHRDGMIHNGTWLGYLTNWYLNGNDRYEGYETAVTGLTSELIRKTASETFGQTNVCTVVQMPE